MLLKTRIFVLLSIVLIGFFLSTGHIIAITSVRLFEDSIATRANSMENAFLSLIEQEKKQISTSVKDYAFWTEMGEFGVIKRDKEWLRENLYPWVKEHFGYELVLLIDKNKEIISGSSDLGINLEEAIPSDKSIGSGFYLSKEGLIIYASSGIFDNDGRRFYNAFLLFGKVIDQGILNSWKKVLQTDIYLSTQIRDYTTNANITKTTFRDGEKIKYQNGYITVNVPIVERDKVLGNFYIYKYDDTPIKLRRMFIFNTISFILLGLSISILMTRFLILRIFKPLDLLKSKAEEISDGRYEVSLDIFGNDEIASLAKSFNKMVSKVKDRETALALAKEKAQEISYTDDLTAIPNRRYMEEYINYLIDSRIRFSLVFLDLDRFKSVNDFLGHQKGDEVLHNIAKWFKSKLREEDMVVSRYGGDEFCIILVGADKEKAHQIIKRLYDSFHEEDFYREEISISFSYGIATFPDEAESLDELLNMADKRMYEMKETKRKNFSLE